MSPKQKLCHSAKWLIGKGLLVYRKSGALAAAPHPGAARPLLVRQEAR